MDRPSRYELYESGGSKLHIKRGETLVSFCGEKLFDNSDAYRFNPGNDVLFGYDIGKVCKLCLKAWRKSKLD